MDGDLFPFACLSSSPRRCAQCPGTDACPTERALVSLPRLVWKHLESQRLTDLDRSQPERRALSPRRKSRKQRPTMNSASLFRSLTLILASFALLLGCGKSSATSSPPAAGLPRRPLPAEVSILNVSYDPTREFYAEYNKIFAEHWKKKSNGQVVTVKQSHGGGGQAGARGDRRPRGRPRDARALVRRRSAQQEGQPDPRELARAPAAPELALHVHDRVRGAQGQPQGHQGLVRSGQARRRR